MKVASVLPDVFPFHEAVKASAISNVLVAAFMSKEMESCRRNDGKRIIFTSRIV